MKRFTVTASFLFIGLLAAWVLFQASPVGSSTGKSDDPSTQMHETSGEIPNSSETGNNDPMVPVTGADVTIAPVFDDNGAVVSDPSGVMLNSHRSENLVLLVTDADAKIAPIYDASGLLVSDPTGTIWNARQAINTVVPVTGADRKVAPVYDTTGALVSDPTGTISNASIR